jgi:ABC-type histidine transport system ATPase subunit
MSQSTHLSMAVTPKAVVVTDSHIKFELHLALRRGAFSACEGEVVSVIGAPKTAHCKKFVSGLE